MWEQRAGLQIWTKQTSQTVYSYRYRLACSACQESCGMGGINPWLLSDTQGIETINCYQNFLSVDLALWLSMSNASLRYSSWIWRDPTSLLVRHNVYFIIMPSRLAGNRQAANVWVGRKRRRLLENSSQVSCPFSYRWEQNNSVAWRKKKFPSVISRFVWESSTCRTLSAPTALCGIQTDE